jgi:hypothetical protein
MYGSDPLYLWAKARQEEWWAEAERQRLRRRSRAMKRSAKRAEDTSGHAEVVALPAPVPAAKRDDTPGAA